jgi:hypothetical protein
VTSPARPVTLLGGFYSELEDAHVASIVTMDALFFVAHLAVERALADVDAGVLRPALSALLHRLDTRLAAEARGARADMEPGYLAARGVVSVALALAEPGYVATKDVSALVDGERARVLARTGVGVSPWLAVPIDYSSMIARGAADADEAHRGWARATAWLEGASLALEGRGEGPVLAQADVWTARAHARAALLLTRLVQYEVDPEASEAWERCERTLELLAGEPDDATARDVSAAAAKLALDVTDGQWFESVARIDKLRHEAARRRVARADDGSGGARGPAAGMDPTEPIGVLAPNFRLLAARATPDGTLLQSLVFPEVGALARAEPPPSARDGVRALPTALDAAAWLGSREARGALHDEGDDAYALYDENLERARSGRPGDAAPERHRDPYASLLDALETWIAPSSGDSFHAGARSQDWGRRKAEVALAAWTELRHDAVPLARGPAADVLPPSTAPAGTAPTQPVLVEANPEAIAKLLAVVRQVRRALVAEGAFPAGAAGRTALDLADRVLATALDAAVSETRGEVLPPAIAASLAALPSELGALEASLSPMGGAEVPIAIDVHADTRSARVLEEALGSLEEVWMVVREPGHPGLYRLVVGASIPHYELVAPAAERLSDASWRARMVRTGEPPPGPLLRAYRFNSSTP